MLEWASQMSDSSSPPLVTSISYGIAESNRTSHVLCEAASMVCLLC